METKKIDKCKKWFKDHLPEIIVYGSATLIGGGIIYGCVKYVDSIPVTVDDVTEVTNLRMPDLKNEVTMYDDRLDCWIPVVRKLTDEEFDEIKQELTENCDKTLVNCLTERELLPNYLYE